MGLLTEPGILFGVYLECRLSENQWHSKCCGLTECIFSRCSDSLMRGWELLCICLFYFPPNKVFRDPLHAYLSARCEALSISSIAPPPGGDPDPVTQLSSVAAPACRPGPSLAAAAALAAGSDPSTLISTPVTPAFGVPLTNGSSHGLSSQDTDGVSVDTASVAGLDQMSMTTMSVGGAPSEFPYGPWVKLSALHFTRAAPRWFMRSVAVGPSRLPMPLAKEDLLHVKVGLGTLKLANKSGPLVMIYCESPHSSETKATLRPFTRYELSRPCLHCW